MRSTHTRPAIRCIKSSKPVFCQPYRGSSVREPTRPRPKAQKGHAEHGHESISGVVNPLLGSASEGNPQTGAGGPVGPISPFSPAPESLGSTPVSNKDLPLCSKHHETSPRAHPTRDLLPATSVARPWQETAHRWALCLLSWEHGGCGFASEAGRRMMIYAAC